MLSGRGLVSVTQMLEMVDGSMMSTWYIWLSMLKSVMGGFPGIIIENGSILDVSVYEYYIVETCMKKYFNTNLEYSRELRLTNIQYIDISQTRDKK